MAFEAGYQWCASNKLVKHTDRKALFFEEDNTLCGEDNLVYCVNNHGSEEIKTLEELALFLKPPTVFEANGYKITVNDDGSVTVQGVTLSFGQVYHIYKACAAEAGSTVPVVEPSMGADVDDDDEDEDDWEEDDDEEYDDDSVNNESGYFGANVGDADDEDDE
jgi:hypothetical protein